MRDRVLWLYPVAILVTAAFVYVVVGMVARNQPPEARREAGTIFNLKTVDVEGGYHFEYDVTFPDGVVSHRGGSGGKIIVDPFRD